MHSQTRGEMFTIVNEYHTLLRKAAPVKTFFFLKKAKFLGNVISSDGVQPTAERADVLRNLKSPESMRRYESHGMSWFLQLLYQKLTS